MNEPEQPPEQSADEDAVPAGSAATSKDSEQHDQKAKKNKKTDGPDHGFVFTDHGCRTEIRAGTLLILAAVFVLLWLGPGIARTLYLIGLPLLLIGVPLQARDAKRDGRPGYPLKLGLTLAIGGLLMWPDLLYRDAVDGVLRTQPTAPMLIIAGLWILAWWPVARGGQARTQTAEGVPA